MDKKRKSIIENNEISQLYTFTLGGYAQKVLVEGKSRNLPVVIFLHGGPGTPIPFSVGCRGLFPDFTDRFIMVYWDQLGCGINDHKIGDDFTIKSFTDMTKDLISEIKKLFPGNKLYLFATSWGSVLSALVSAECPDAIDGVIASGQIVRNLFFNEEVVGALEKSDIPPKKLEMIKSVNPGEASLKEIQMISTCLTKYTDAYNNKNGKSAPMGEVIKGLLTSPDYKFKDFKAIMVNGFRGNNSLWKELLQTDLTDTLIHISIPYMILQGDTDVVASTQTVRSLVEGSGNKNLKCLVVKNTGHLPGIEMMDEILKQLTEMTGD